MTVKIEKQGRRKAKKRRESEGFLLDLEREFRDLLHAIGFRV
jgi:hypothetical protein